MQSSSESNLLCIDDAGNPAVHRSLAFSRRRFLAGSGSLFGLAACGGGEEPRKAPQVDASTAVAPAQAPAQASFTGVPVSRFYDPLDGRNLQPAFQKAIDYAGSRGLPAVVNDWQGDPSRLHGEMWCPERRSPYGLQDDGIPLVVRRPLEIDFGGFTITLRGPGGTDRMKGQAVAGFDQPWLGGWLYVIGNPEFGRVAIRNVTVEGDYTGDVNINSPANVSDKGFRIQDTTLSECVLENVELRNFAGEIYYIGGLGPDRQIVRNCHFHGSPQSAWNPGGVGTVQAENLKAGRAYQATEVLGGRGHTYSNCYFYDSGFGGTGFGGGPSPRIPAGYPYWYAYWDGVGEPPWITFIDCVFENIRFINVGSWIRGRIKTIDSPVWTNPLVGHLRAVDLQIDALCDSQRGLEALGVHGIEPGLNQVPQAPDGTHYQLPSDLRLVVRCSQTDRARRNDVLFQSAARFYGTLIDPETTRIAISGSAWSAVEAPAVPRPGFRMPAIDTTGFFIR